MPLFNVHYQGAVDACIVVEAENPESARTRARKLLGSVIITKIKEKKGEDNNLVAGRYGDRFHRFVR